MELLKIKLENGILEKMEHGEKRVVKEGVEYSMVPSQNQEPDESEHEQNDGSSNVDGGDTLIIAQKFTQMRDRNIQREHKKRQSTSHSLIDMS